MAPSNAQAKADERAAAPVPGAVLQVCNRTGELDGSDQASEIVSKPHATDSSLRVW
jgi:hypothetical protein